jgi:hypothetical protein
MVTMRRGANLASKTANSPKKPVVFRPITIWAGCNNAVLRQCHPQFDPIVGRVDEILHRAQVPLRRLNGGVT